MPRTATEVKETIESITRPVVYEVLRQLYPLLNLPGQTSLMIPGMVESAPNIGSTLGFSGDPNSFRYKGQLRVEVTETFIEDSVLATAIQRLEHEPIFHDPKLGVRIVPIYSATQMTLTCQYRAPNRVMAERFRDEALMRTAMLRQENLHDFHYHYSLPDSYNKLLRVIHTMRETVAPYGEDFDTWFGNHVTGRATNLTTQIGTQSQVAIAEHQIAAIGWFDFTAAPEPAVKEQDTGPYNLQFTYTLNYDKVIGCTMQWPLMVHNQIIDETYRFTPNASGVQINPDRRLRRPSLTRHALDFFTDQHMPLANRNKGFVIPEYDDWIPNGVHPSTASVLTIMLEVTLTDPREVVSLYELGDYEIDPEILIFLRGEAPWLNQYGESVIHLTLYRDGDPLDDGSLVIDEDLNVRSRIDLDPRERYHLRVEVITDLTLLTASALKRLRENGAVCLKILLSLQERLTGCTALPTLVGGQIVSKTDLLKWADKINQGKCKLTNVVDYRMLTVGNYLVTAHRRSAHGDR